MSKSRKPPKPPSDELSNQTTSVEDDCKENILNPDKITNSLVLIKQQRAGSSEGAEHWKTAPFSKVLDSMVKHRKKLQRCTPDNSLSTNLCDSQTPNSKVPKSVVQPMKRPQNGDAKASSKGSPTFTFEEPVNQSQDETQRGMNEVSPSTNPPSYSYHQKGVEKSCPTQVDRQYFIGQYQWQIKNANSDDVWHNVTRSLNEDIELCFCDVRASSCRLKNPESGIPTKFHFKKMTFRELTVTKNSGSLRRLEVDEGEDVHLLRAAGFSTATAWQWYWQNDVGDWEAYRRESFTLAHVDSVPSDANINRITERNCDILVSRFISSDEIEWRFRDKSQKHFRFTLQRDGKSDAKYQIDFDKMVQVNLNTKFERKIRRRPAWYRSAERYCGILQTVLNPDDVAVRCPTKWDKEAIICGSRYQLISVSEKGESVREYLDVVNSFWQSMPRDPPKVVWRVQNRCLWDDFVRFRRQMEKRLGREVTSRRLFHGTDNQCIRPICEQGFDCRISGMTNGVLFGKGSYFADTAGVAASYTNSGTIFVVSVLVGDYTLGEEGIVRPPPKNPLNSLAELYDSCVNDIKNPSVFVTFDARQSYPEYLIEY